MNLEERLRRALSDKGRGYPPSPDAWTRIHSRLESRRELTPRGRILTAGLALAIGFAGVGLAVVAFSGTSDSVIGARERHANPSPRIAESLNVPALLGGIIPIAGQAWVIEPEQSLSANCDGALGRVGSNQGGGIELTSVVPTGGTPKASALAGDDLLIIQYVCKGDALVGEIVRMDAATGQRIDVLASSQDGAPSAISEHGSTVITIWQQAEGLAVVVATDRASGQEIASSEIRGRISDLVSTEGALWVLDSGPQQGFLLKLDPDTLRELDRVELGESPSGLVVGQDGSIWVGAGDKLARVDPSGTVTYVDTNGVGPTPIGADANGVWYIGADREGPGSVLAHLNSASSSTDSSLVMGFSVDGAAVDAAYHRIWLTTVSDEISTRLVMVEY